MELEDGGRMERLILEAYGKFWMIDPERIISLKSWIYCIFCLSYFILKVWRNIMIWYIKQW